MKIETDISKNYFSCFDESRGFAIHKNKVIRNKTNKTLSYIESKLIILILLLSLSVALTFLARINISIIILPIFLYILTIIYFLEIIIDIIATYLYRKKKNFINTILINENGITDESYYGIKMTFNWNKIKGIVIGEYTVTILTDTPVYFYFDISKKSEILKAIEKYGNKNLIIK